ncbi:MAG: TIGR01459 family HAD-type hydrolase [Acetobacteraceae bacterium]|nr:TIGR01459 family HAD-type hydrolase [Acetobacteraceae bacterium]
MKFLDRFAAIAADYDGFICDLWGVIHDGVNPLPDAPECLRHIEAAGKRVVLLTNAPRRADAIIRQLREMGIGDSLYDGVMSSGEAAHIMLRDRPDDWYRAIGTRMFFIGPDRDRAVVAGLDITAVDDPADATFILNAGPDNLADPSSASEWDPVLARCAEHRLPMICANPDLEVIRGGVRVLCAGTLALRYLEMGGDARLLGKPDPAIYGPVLDILAMPKSRVLAVGDALRTDIAGAAATGLDSCWVLGGLHGEVLSGDRTAIEAAASAAGLAPVATLPTFVW